MSKYKVGDRVKVREDLNISERYGTNDFVSTMRRFRGSSVTIARVCSAGNYNLVEDVSGCFWTDEMFAGLAEEPLIDIEFEEKHRDDVIDAVSYAFRKLSGKPDDSPDDAEAPTVTTPDDFKVGDYVRVTSKWDERYQEIGKVILSLANDHCFLRFEDKEEIPLHNSWLEKLAAYEPHPEIKSSSEERAGIEKKPKIGTIEMVFSEEKKQEIIEEIKDAYMKFIYDRPAVEPDPVNHPAHYADRPVEVMDTIEEVTAHYPAAVAYHIGAAIKYIFRGPFKGKLIEDLRKANHYLNRAIELLEETK